MPKSKVAASPLEGTARIAMFSTPAAAVTSAGTRRKRAAKQLMKYVLKPTKENIIKAKEMIAANPKVMFIKTKGVELASGVEQTLLVRRVVKSSPFQAALGAGDEELYKFMAQHFDKIEYKYENEHGEETVETGRQRAQKQIQEQFPNGFQYPAVEEALTDLMNETVAAITNNALSDKCTEVLIKFSNYFIPKDVTQGHQFNLNYLFEAIKLYADNYDN